MASYYDKIYVKMSHEGGVLLNINLADVDTPALLLDIDKMERNIEGIASFSKEAGVAVRPHIKTHKSIEIAKRQIESGAIGLTVAKVGEAEVMVDGGITDILIAYPLVAKKKLERVRTLMKKAVITVAIDSIEQAKILQDFFTEKNPLNVMIKVNSGLNRVGVEPNEEVLELAKYIDELSALKLTGIFTHAGHSYAAKSEIEIDKIAKEEADAVLKSAELCEAAGIKITTRSIGSTPTFKKAGLVEGITEIRPGNAVFYDMVQVGLGVATIEQCALTVMASVVSKKADRIVIDAGSKTLALDQGAHGNASIAGHGFVKEHSEFVIERLSEEHGVIPISGETDIKLNDRLTIIPNHACVVANLFNHYLIHRNGKVIERWKVDARGRVN